MGELVAILALIFIISMLWGYYHDPKKKPVKKAESPQTEANLDNQQTRLRGISSRMDQIEQTDLAQQDRAQTLKRQGGKYSG